MADVLEVIITGTDKLSGVMTNIAGGMGKLGLLAGGAVVTGIAAVGGAAFAAGLQLDEAFDNIRISTGATNEDLDELQEVFKDVFTSVPTDAGSASDAISVLGQRTELTAEQMEGLAKPLLEMTRMTGGDAKTNTELFTRVMGDWGVANEDAAGTLDMMFKASQETGIGVDSLMSKVVQFGSPMRLMGFTMEETAALFGKFEKEGVNAELVMGSLRIAAGKFANANVPLQEGLMDTFDSIKNNTDASAALADGMEIFGARAGPDMVAAIREGRFNLDDLVKSLEGADGAIMDTAAETADFAEKFTILKNKATVALEPLGSAMMTVVGIIADSLLPYVERLVPIVEDWGGKITNLVGAFTDAGLVTSEFAEALGLIIGEDLAFQLLEIARVVQEFVNGTVIPFVQQHGPLLKSIFIAIGAAIAGAAIVGLIMSIVGAIAALFNPITLVIGVIALLATAWINNWGGIQEKTEAVINFIKPLVQAFLTAITGFWDAHGEQIVSAAKAAWEGIKGAISGVLTFVGNLIRGALSAIKGFWDAHGTQIISAAKAAWDAIQAAIEAVLGIIESLWKAWNSAREGDWRAFGENLRAAWEQAWQLIKDVLSKAWEAIKTVVGNLIKSIIDKFKETDWTALAKAVIDGIITGLKNGVAGVVTAAKELAKAAFDAAMGFLDAKSPSRLFMEVGEAIALGLIAGINKSTPKVEEAVRKMLDVAGNLGSIASSMSGFFQFQKLDPLKKELDGVQNVVDDMVGSFQEKFGELFGGDLNARDIIQLRGIIAAAAPGTFEGFDTQDMSRSIEDLAFWWDILNRKQVEYSREQARILELEKQQANLGFLQQQVQLLDLIRENQLDAGSILRGMQLGINANAGGVIDAMARAMEMMIDKAEQSLGIGSPSKVFREMGTNIVSGLANGIADNNRMVSNAMTGTLSSAQMAVTRTGGRGNGAPVQLVVQYQPYISTMDRVEFDAKVLPLLEGAIKNLQAQQVV